jgi:hypothetical protein
LKEYSIDSFEILYYKQLIEIFVIESFVPFERFYHKSFDTTVLKVRFQKNLKEDCSQQLVVKDIEYSKASIVIDWIETFE